MPLNPQQSIAHYRIETKLGSGGMGIVYRAFDARLQRQVALKVLSGKDLADRDSKQQLVREARAASALNHPNIVTVYEVGSEGAVDFIAMEFVDGKTLDAMIPPTGLLAATALDYATQIAGGLAKAHAAGVVHRDLKPGNIMVTREGLVKLLDFGLARQVRLAPDQDTTITVDGAIAGTPAYMSPEQVEAKPADARSDIFSFGVVLYEMLSGRRLFSGDSAASVLAAVLRDEAVPLGDNVSPDLDKIVRRCLRKDPDRRFQSVADLRVALQDVAQESKAQPVGESLPAVQRSRRWLWFAAGALPLFLLAGWWSRNYWQPELPEPKLVQLTSNPGVVCCPSFSPDGKQMVFMWTGEKGNHPDIYVKMVGEVNAMRLTNGPAAASFPTWSPDGKRIAYRRAAPGGGIWTVSPLGGAEQKLADIKVAGPMSWSPDGKWLAAARYSNVNDPGQGNGLLLVPSDGSEPRRISNPREPAYDTAPSFSPDGRFLAYASCPAEWSCDVFVQEMDSSQIPRGSSRRITHQGLYITGLAWSRDGGSLIYGASASGIYMFRIWRVDRRGKREPKRYDLAGFGASQPIVAPTDDRLAFHRSVNDTHIWRYQAGEEPKPFLASSTVEANVEFSPDGSRVAFSSGRSGDRVQIWLADADGSRLVPLRSGLGTYQALPQWSPNGRRIAFQSNEDDGQCKIYVIDAEGGLPRQVAGGANDALATWSRDGKSIYFRSSRSGRAEIWRVPSDGGQAQQVTENGGLHAVESLDGKTLFYSYQGGVFARQLTDGSEQRVLDSVIGKLFTPVADGIYYIGSRGPDARHRPLQFYDFAKRNSHLVTNLEGGFAQGGLSVSPDRKTILYTATVHPVSDLMMIENFR